MARSHEWSVSRRTPLSIHLSLNPSSHWHSHAMIGSPMPTTVSPDFRSARPGTSRIPICAWGSESELIAISSGV